MMISHEFKMIFIHVHRTGGTTLSNLLMQEMGTDVEIISQHGNAKGSEVALLDEHPDYFTFGFVRNPWERLVSWYDRINTAGIGKNMATNNRADFEGFLMSLAESSANDPNFHFNQLDYFTDKSGVIRTDKIGRFETYEADLKSLLEAFGYHILDIPKLNATHSRDYQSYYTVASEQLIAEICSKDITHFGYKF